MSVALLQEVRSAVSFKQQPDLVTPCLAASMWSLRQTNTDLIQAQPTNEDDANDLGKGIYITQTFPEFIASGGNWNGRFTSEAAAMLVLFGMGSDTASNVTTSSVSGGTQYVVESYQPILEGLGMPAATMLFQIRTGGSAITDKLLTGMVCEEFGFEWKIGPGRDNAVFTSTWVGTGKFTKPSSYTMPAIYQEHSMNAGTLDTITLTHNTGFSAPDFNYVTNLRFVNLNFKWKNNFRDNSSYFPGSGQQSGYQLRGRMRRGVPTLTLTADVEADSGSSEEDWLLAQDEGTLVVQSTSATSPHQLNLTFHRVIPRSVPIQDADGIASYKVDFSVAQDTSTGKVLTATATCAQAGILSVGP